jgi:hypothetical protein
MTRFLPVKEQFGLVRDAKSGGIINVDENSYKKYKTEKKILQQKIEKEISQENRLNTLEKKVDSIEDKLSKILELLTNGNT